MRRKEADNPHIQLFVQMVIRFLHTLLFRKAEYTDYGERGAGEKPGRSYAIRVVDCGSSGAAEQEILAIFNPVYDAERFGFSLASSPRHADILLVSGPLSRNMEAALLATFEAMPEPRRVVTLGDDFTGQGVFKDSYAIVPLPEMIAAARVAHIPGNPPTPAEILETLRKIPY